MSRHTSIIVSTVVILFAQAAVAGDKWDMPLAGGAANYHVENTVRFARDVREATDGALDITVHPDGSLLKGNDIFRAVRNGTAPIGERLISALGNEDAIFEIDALPFLATSFEDALRLHEAAKPALEKVLTIKGVKLLYAVPWPPLGLYVKKPVTSAADMAGVTFRVNNAATSRLAELLGAIPAKVEADELAKAFASGVATSMISSGSTGYDRKIWQHVKYWYDAHAWLPKNMVVVNLAAWNALNEVTKAAVLKAAADAEARGWARARERAAWYKKKFAENGMVVGPPSERLQAEFKAIGAKMMEEWLERAGDHGRKAINAYRKM